MKKLSHISFLPTPRATPHNPRIQFWFLFRPIFHPPPFLFLYRRRRRLCASIIIMEPPTPFFGGGRERKKRTFVKEWTMQQSGFFTGREEGKPIRTPRAQLLFWRNFGETKVCLCLLLITLGPAWYIMYYVCVQWQRFMRKREKEMTKKIFL